MHHLTFWTLFISRKIEHDFIKTLMIYSQPNIDLSHWSSVRVMMRVQTPLGAIFAFVTLNR